MTNKLLRFLCHTKKSGNRYRFSLCGVNIDYFSPKDLAAKIDKLEQHVDALNETILSLIQDCQEVKHAQQALTLEELRRRFPHPVVGGNIPNWALREQHPFLYTLLNAQKLVSVNDHGTYAVSQSDIIYSFSGRWLQWKLFPILFAIRNKPFFFLEDGFLKNIVTTAANAKENQIDPRYQVSVCYSIDDLTFHFDALRPSRLERMLNSSELTVSGEQQARARRLMQRLVGEKLTKYNHQPVYTPVIGSAGRPKVLVVEQAYQDFSVVRSGANHETFKKMLRDAVTENPGADIIVKLHPDTLVGGWGGNSYYAQVRQEKNIYPVAMEINPFSLLEIVDKVYVCSSQLGVEALMAGKEVHVYGLPFYAGWGLTRDQIKCPRRTRTRTLEELVYIAYILYSHYVIPGRDTSCEIEDAVDYLLELRREYFEKFKICHER